MDDHQISRRGALKYFGLLSASLAGREFLASWLPMQIVRGDEHSSSVAIAGSRAHVAGEHEHERERDGRRGAREVDGERERALVDRREVVRGDDRRGAEDGREPEAQAGQPGEARPRQRAPGRAPRRRRSRRSRPPRSRYAPRLRRRTKAPTTPTRIRPTMIGSRTSLVDEAGALGAADGAGRRRRRGRGRGARRRRARRRPRRSPSGSRWRSRAGWATVNVSSPRSMSPSSADADVHLIW